MQNVVSVSHNAKTTESTPFTNNLILSDNFESVQVSEGTDPFDDALDARFHESNASLIFSHDF